MIIDTVISTAGVWDEYAAYAQVPLDLQNDVAATHRIELCQSSRSMNQPTDPRMDAAGAPQS